MNLKDKPFYLNDEEEKWVFDNLSSMTDKQKVGQLFCVLGSIFSDEELEKLVSEYNIGGILFRPEPAEVIKKRYEKLDLISSVPLLKAANLEEGGAGAISDGTYFASQMQTAAANNIKCVEVFAENCASEGKSVGINWTFSPVCDIDMNFRNPITNIRTFGSSVSTVKRCTKRYTDTVQKFGIAACAKHFPGDGVDFRDQHLHPSVNSLSAKRWYQTYGRVYQNLIDGGLMSIMVGHIKQPAVEMEINPKLDYKDTKPASLSQALMTGVLRNKFNFNGVITTDATIMGGYTMAMERSRALPTTIQAGCDMIVFNTDFYEDYQFMLDGVEKGILSTQRLDEAVTRILAMKARLCLGKFSSVIKNSKNAVKECADKSVTLVKNIGDILPITTDRYKKIRLIVLGKDLLSSNERISDYTIKRLSEKGFSVELYSREADDMHGVKCLNRDRLTLYIANEPTESNRVTVRLSWNPKHAMDAPRYIYEEPSVFVSLSNPYHLQDVPAVKVYVNAYAPTPQNVDAVIEKLTGRSQFKGKSPVDAFCGLNDTKY